MKLIPVNLGEFSSTFKRNLISLCGETATSSWRCTPFSYIVWYLIRIFISLKHVNRFLIKLVILSVYFQMFLPTIMLNQVISENEKEYLVLHSKMVLAYIFPLICLLVWKQNMYTCVWNCNFFWYNSCGLVYISGLWFFVLICPFVELSNSSCLYLRMVRGWITQVNRTSDTLKILLLTEEKVVK